MASIAASLNTRSSKCLALRRRANANTTTLSQRYRYQCHSERIL
jgi:hypothetical protein